MVLMEKLVTGFAALGAFLLLSKATNFLSSAYATFLRPRLCLSTRYGPKSWVLITGGGSGVGFGFAQAFAHLGFNLILIDRDPKVIRVSNDLSAQYKVETLPMILDFSETQGSEQDFVSAVTEKLRNYDVSVLVNNVGTCVFSEFQMMRPEQITNCVLVNVKVMTKLTQLVLQKFKSRKERSAVINMSSVAGVIPTPWVAVYSATKAYIRAFSLALAEEVKDHVDVLAVEPAVIRTQMSSKVKHDFFSISPETLAWSALDRLGQETETMGATRHILLYKLTAMLSEQAQVSRKGSIMKQLL